MMQQFASREQVYQIFPPSQVCFCYRKEFGRPNYTEEITHLLGVTLTGGLTKAYICA